MRSGADGMTDQNSEALAILRRLEPMLARIEADRATLARIEAMLPTLADRETVARIDERMAGFATKGDLAELKTETKANVAALRNEVQAGVHGTREEIAKLGFDLTWRFLTLLGVMLAAYLGAVWFVVSLTLRSHGVG